MSLNLTCRLLSFRGSFLQNLKNRDASTAWNISSPRGYHEKMSDKLRNRLRAVPYLNLLDQEVGRIEKDICYKKDDRLKNALNRSSKVFNYNTKDGKLIRPTNLLKAYCTYGFNLDDDKWNQYNSDGWISAITLAWCCELLHGYLLMLDDIMDQSVLRRGKVCWYKKPEVGLCAINDSFLLEKGIYKVLQRHFANAKCYINILHEFFQGIRIAVYGECLDIINTKDKVPSFSKFTFERYQTIAEYKADSTYRLPIHLAMHLVEGIPVKEFDLTRNICLKIGLYYQSLDDVLDYLGNANLTGKFGNDIRGKKCTWTSVKFLEEASEPIKKHFLEIYGRKDSISKVAELYRSIDLLERFHEFEKHLFMEIKDLIKSMNDNKAFLYYDLLAEAKKRKELLVSIEK